MINTSVRTNMEIVRIGSSNCSITIPDQVSELVVDVRRRCGGVIVRRNENVAVGEAVLDRDVQSGCSCVRALEVVLDLLGDG